MSCDGEREAGGAGVSRYAAAIQPCRSGLPIAKLIEILYDTAFT
jgi:hypothetical protein